MIFPGFRRRRNCASAKSAKGGLRNVCLADETVDLVISPGFRRRRNDRPGIGRSKGESEPSVLLTVLFYHIFSPLSPLPALEMEKTRFPTPSFCQKDITDCNFCLFNKLSKGVNGCLQPAISRSHLGFQPFQQSCQQFYRQSFQPFQQSFQQFAKKPAITFGIELEKAAILGT